MLGVGLGQIINVLSKFESPNIRVDAMQCSRLRHKNSTCTRCADHCYQNAITWEASLKIDADKCTGCGVCAAVCPTGALEAASPTNTELLNRIAQRKGAACIAFACSKALSVPDERVIPVNCIGRLEESILVGAASLRIEQIFLVDGACQDCPNAVGQTAAVRAVSEANALINAFGTLPRISFASQLPPTPTASGESFVTAEVVSRRAFFTLLTHETKVAAAFTIGTVLESANESKTEIKKGELPQRVPERRQLLLNALTRLGKPKSAVFETENEAWATCRINESCNGCQMCAFFCPTGALSKTEQDGKHALAFRVAYCTNCRVCQDICFWKALNLSGTIDLVKVLEEASDTFTFAGATARESPEAKLKRLVGSLH